MDCCFVASLPWWPALCIRKGRRQGILLISPTLIWVNANPLGGQSDFCGRLMTTVIFDDLSTTFFHLRVMQNSIKEFFICRSPVRLDFSHGPLRGRPNGPGDVHSSCGLRGRPGGPPGRRGQTDHAHNSQSHEKYSEKNSCSRYKLDSCAADWDSSFSCCSCCSWDDVEKSVW